jgi:hypothetical protein
MAAALVRGANTRILGEQVMSLVFRSINWDHSQALCTVASVGRRLHAVAERVLWHELYISRAPQMVASLTAATAGGLRTAPGHIGGGWPALAKILSVYCGAAAGTAAPVPGHLTKVSRFSKTSSRSFLSPCRAVVGARGRPAVRTRAGSLRRR